MDTISKLNLTSPQILPPDQIKGNAWTHLPWNAIFPCSTMTLFVYLWLGMKIMQSSANQRDEERWQMLQNVDYLEAIERMEPIYHENGPVTCSLKLASIIYWIILPLSMVIFGFLATCEAGAPAWAYGIYVCFLVIHLGCVAFAFFGKSHDVSDKSETETTETMGDPGTLKFYEMLWGQDLGNPMTTLFLLSCGVLEHFDMATDALFTGTAAACSDAISALWLQSWRDVPVLGAAMENLMTKTGFAGLALMLFVSTTYLPQLLCMVSFLAPMISLFLLLLMIAWLWYGWQLGLTMIFLAFLVVIISPLGEKQWSIIQAATGRDADMACYLGMEALAGGREQGAKEYRLVGLALTKILLENVVQLWLQTSFLSLSFEHLDTKAKIQSLASILVGVMVTSSKLTELPLAFTRVHVPKEIMACELLLFTLGLLFLMWIIAKMIFIFRCDSHVWNLSTGCVT
eukprot:symbB.v1.2.039236.t1/scaffold6432.1/size18157/2